MSAPPAPSVPRRRSLLVTHAAGKLDHFRHEPGKEEDTFQQRYFVCSQYWGEAKAQSQPDRTQDGDQDGDQYENQSGDQYQDRDGDQEGSPERRLGGTGGRGRGGENATASAQGPIFFYVSRPQYFSLLVVQIMCLPAMWQSLLRIARIRDGRVVGQASPR